jgi:CheY-like chemotaxis protein
VPSPRIGHIGERTIAIATRLHARLVHGACAVDVDDAGFVCVTNPCGEGTRLAQDASFAALVETVRRLRLSKLARRPRAACPGQGICNRGATGEDPHGDRDHASSACPWPRERIPMDSPSLAGCKVLVVEDEDLVSMLVQDLLVDCKCRIAGVASRVDEALRLVGDADFDVAILDLNLAGTESFAVADALAAKGIPCVLATGFGRAGLPDAYREAVVLQKPFRGRELQQALRLALSTARR